MPFKESPLVDARLDRDPAMEAGIAPSAGRLPAATRLGHVWLQVADLARSIEYYERVLGLLILTRQGSEAVLGSEDGATPLVRLTEKTGVRAVASNGRLGLYHFAILLPDRAA